MRRADAPVHSLWMLSVTLNGRTGEAYWFCPTGQKSLHRVPQVSCAALNHDNENVVVVNLLLCERGLNIEKQVDQECMSREQRCI